MHYKLELTLKKDMRTIFSEVMKKLAATNPLPKAIAGDESAIQTCMDTLLDDCGGNPQVEKLLLVVLAAINTKKKSFGI